jgi:cysteine peptidase C11 family protein
MSDLKEWTLMFYMASDNPLATSIVSQLKALKNAGFHDEVNVIAQFDPFTPGTPTHVFDVNRINKLQKKGEPNIGFEKGEPPARNLIEDRLWNDEVNRNNEPIRKVLSALLEKKHDVKYEPPIPPNLNGSNGASAVGDENTGVSRAGGNNGHDANANNGHKTEPDPFPCLQAFLQFCAEKFPARHYMLFMLGHGVVVGNDIFMYDEHAETHSIKLQQMGQALTEFRTAIKAHDGTFELVGFHSCSVSSLEVAWELKETANYMLASQGPTFVGSWPYRQILVRIFKEVEDKRNAGDIKQIITDVFNYCLNSSGDFLLAGYSHQLTLCDLTKVGELQGPMSRLSTALREALSPVESPNQPLATRSDAISAFVILYSHWKSQSFFQEMYTDLYDFCWCIVERCERIEEGGSQLTARLTPIRDACVEVMAKLAKPDTPDVKDKRRPPNKSTVVVASEFVGPAYQYSRGLSVYFPWSRPSLDSQVMQEYAKYKFTSEFRDSSPQQFTWLDFLERYFDETQRRPKKQETRDQLKWKTQTQKPIIVEPSDEQILMEDMASVIYVSEGAIGGSALAKDSPSDKTGGDCECYFFKNYPRDIRPRNDRRKVAQPMQFTETLLGDF